MDGMIASIAAGWFSFMRIVRRRRQFRGGGSNYSAVVGNNTHLLAVVQFEAQQEQVRKGATPPLPRNRAAALLPALFSMVGRPLTRLLSGAASKHPLASLANL